MKIDIIRTSASRPDFFRESTESLKKYLKFSGEFRWIMHEDYLKPKLSDEVCEYAKEAKYDIILRDDPPIGQCPSLQRLMDVCTATYILNWEDDHTLIRDLNLDLVWNLLENNSDINQIAFHKRAIMRRKPGFEKKEVIRDGISLVVSPHWSFIPAIARASFIKPRWIPIKGTNCHWEMNAKLKGVELNSGNRRDADWIEKNLGVYFLGKFGEPAYSKHIGAEQSVRDEVRFK